jgi:cytochrome c peroxidase
MNPMKCIRTSAILAACTAFAAAAAPSVDPEALRARARDFIQPIPDRMPGAEKDTPAKIELGRKLYFDKQLSMNKSQSCNTCHVVDGNKGGVDNEPTSLGAFGKRGGRNSPTVLNAGFQFAQFWDGRAATLEHQAKGPVLNPVEMAMPSEAVVIERLTASKEYQAAFKQAFPNDPQPVTYDNVANAIAAFERTLITRDRFDDFLKGDNRALSAAELKGLQTFLDVGCTTCHHGPVMGGNSYQKVGLVNPFPTSDKGRSEVTKDPDDDFKFKVPMLRNIALTHPYFHDGQVKTLEEAVKKMAWHQLGKELTADEIKSIATFLAALTDKPRGGNKRAGAE